MMAKHLSWQERWQRALSREITFLPKRLVLLTLLLLTLYLGLLVRTDQKLRTHDLGFVEASLQSKLVADYERAKEPPARFAPLRLEILRAKLQDEHPDWSAAEVEAALQLALAAAVAPILPATPTPYPTTRMIVQAAALINNQQLLSNPAATAHTRLPSALPAATAVMTAPAVLAVRIVAPSVAEDPPPPVAFPLVNKPTDQPQGGQTAVDKIQPTATPMGIVLRPQSAAQTPIATRQQTPVLVDAVIGAPATETPTLTHPQMTAAPLPTVDSSPTTLPADHLAAAYPNSDESAPPAPTLITPTVAPAIALWTPTPMVATPTTLPTESKATPAHQPTGTATSLAIAPASPNPLLTLTPDLPPPEALLPSPTPTTSTAPSPTPTVSPTPTLLPTIGGLTVQITEEKVILRWDAAAGNILGYNLYRGETMERMPGERRNVNPLTESLYVDTAPLDGKRYFYQVTAIDAQNRESSPSPAVMATMADHTAPRTPSLLSLHLSNNQIQIRWQANTEADLAGYRLYRSTSWPVDQSVGPLHGATLLTTSAYVDEVLLNGQTYHYIFTAVDQAGNESRPSIDAQMPTIDLAPPAAPTGLQATDEQGRIELTWPANSDPDLAGYRIYRSETLPVDTNAPPIHSQPLLVPTTYADSTVEAGKRYYYVVVAVDVNQNSSTASEAVLGEIE